MLLVAAALDEGRHHLLLQFELAVVDKDGQDGELMQLEEQVCKTGHEIGR